MNRVLVVAAHPDDEVLGCGGTIARHAESGDYIGFQFMTDGVGSREAGSGEKGQRYKSLEKAVEFLGGKDMFSASYPDNSMDTLALLEIVKTVEKTIERTRPRIVYTHFPGDLNIDHQLTHRAVITACRPTTGCSVTEIYCFEVLSSTEWASSISPTAFQPNLVVDISATFEKKVEALRIYQSEMRDPPHSRSMEAVSALAAYRGQTHGFTFAEAFQVERILRK